MTHVCHWWLGSPLASRVRELIQDPEKILSPYVHSGATVLEPGPGMGFFTLELARRVGEGGKVVAIDLQPQMLDGVHVRAARSGLISRIALRRVGPESLGIDDLAGQVDFALVFWMLHEVPDQGRFLTEIAAALKAGGKVLLCEPLVEVPERAFERSLEIAKTVGLRVESRPAIRISRAAVLER